MSIAFAPTASQLSTLQYAWYGPYNDTIIGNTDTTQLGTMWYGPANYYAPTTTQTQSTYLSHAMMFFMP